MSANLPIRYSYASPRTSVETVVLPRDTPESPSIRSLRISSVSISRVAPVGGAENTIESVRVGALDLPHGVRECGADISRGLPDVAPVATGGYVEAVNLRESHGVGIPEQLRGVCRLLVPNVRDALEEQQWQDVRFPVRAIYGATAEDLCALPQS